MSIHNSSNSLENVNVRKIILKTITTLDNGNLDNSQVGDSSRVIIFSLLITYIISLERSIKPQFQQWNNLHSIGFPQKHVFSSTYFLRINEEWMTMIMMMTN